MTRRRQLTINSMLVLLIAGSLFDIALGVEHWPLSHYPMYSNARHERTLTTLRAYGVTEAGEVPLLEAARIAPFDQSRLTAALSRVIARGRRIESALLDCLRRYEGRRQRGGHDGPALTGIRLYRVAWELDPWARNVDRPRHRELVAEVSK